MAQKEWFADHLALLVDESLKLLMPWNLLVQSHVKVSQGLVATPSCLETVERLGHKAGFSKKVAEVVATGLRKSTACLYQGKWSKILHWCCRRNVALCKAADR